MYTLYIYTYTHYLVSASRWNLGEWLVNLEAQQVAAVSATSARQAVGFIRRRGVGSHHVDCKGFWEVGLGLSE